MAETESKSQPDAQSDDERLRKRLLQRVTVAGLLVVVLLGALAVFDRFYVSIDKPPARMAARKPLPPAEPAIEEKPVEPASADKADKAEEPPPVKEAAVEPERSAAPVGPAPAVAERPLTAPPQLRPAMMRSSPEPLAMPRKPEPAKELSHPPAPPARPAAPSIPMGPISRSAESARQFLLQMGVFTNVANAEELRAKLELAGIPAQIEARVQVGPFTSRQEAEQAREKLKSLGMAPGLVMAAHK